MRKVVRLARPRGAGGAGSDGDLSVSRREAATRDGVNRPLRTAAPEEGDQTAVYGRVHLSTARRYLPW